MATLHPFRAVRPRPDAVADVASVPYDVVSAAEARALAAGNARSFLHVARPEIDLAPATDVHADAVYDQGAANLRAFVEADYTVQEDAPAVYVYRLAMDGRAQTGLFACVAVAAYDDGTILKHEKTRPAKEDDRTRHLLAQQAHAEPVMLTFRDDERVAQLVAEAQAADPLFDFTAADGVGHTLWRVADPAPLVEAFRAVPRLYVADGHHRCKAASRAAETMRARTAERAAAPKAAEGPVPEYAFFPAALFPMGQMHILPYNRVVLDLPMDAGAFLDAVAARMPLERDVDAAAPPAAGHVGLYLGGAWHRATLPATVRDGLAASLDVARLGEHLLEPLLGITDPRRDPNIDFVGGIRGTGELVTRVDTGAAALALAMYPTAIDDLVAVSDAGELMPPKSTWFEPKLASGLLVHLFE